MLQSETEIKDFQIDSNDAENKLRECIEVKNELIRVMADLPKPSGNQRYKGNVMPEFEEWYSKRAELLQNEQKILRLKTILGINGEKKKKEHLSRVCLDKALKTNLTESQLQKLRDYQKNGDDTAEIDLGLNKEGDTQRQNSILRKLLNEQLVTIKGIRKQLSLFMAQKESELDKIDFADLIKSISAVNKSVPSESEINKMIVLASKIN